MVVVAGDVAGRAVLDRAGLVGEGVPDREATVVLVVRAFDLVGGGRGAPLEAIGKLQKSHCEIIHHCGTEGTKVASGCRGGWKEGEKYTKR